MGPSSSPPCINVKRKLFTATFCILAAVVVLSIVHLFSNINISNYDAYAQQYTASSHPIQNFNNNTNHNILSTLGIATAKVKPDKVTLVFGVETTNKTANAALSTNSATMNRVLNVLLAVGVKENETSTSAFSISPNYNYSKSGSRNVTGFTVTNSIQIESSTINSTAKWIDTAVSSGGATTVKSIGFTLSEKKLEEIKNGLKQAINNARSKADIAASTLGLKLLGVKSMSVNEFERSSPPQPLLQKLEAAAPASANATPIISGQQEVSVGVSIEWLMK
jgi:uncharacterized protein